MEMDTSAVTSTSQETVADIYKLLVGAQPLKIVVALIILVVGVLIVRMVMKRFSLLLEQNEKLQSIQAMLRSVLHFILDLVVVLIAASYVGIPLTSVLALVSVLGLAVSLAIQGLLTNLTAGIIIIISNPFKVGDFIESGSQKGTVTEIRILHTRLMTRDGVFIFIPNNIIYSSSLINYTAGGRRMVELQVSASYDNTPEEVRKAIKTAINRTSGILANPEPQVYLNSYNDSSICYDVWVWVNCPDFLPVKYALNENLYQAFKDTGVEMTYPHLNLHVQN